ncbi:MAG: hypothetical protein IJS10_00515 [Alphaproteobacteria bacterium]|nr:hypothetical protein [Alphaproteobacteria bacterium]
MNKRQYLLAMPLLTVMSSTSCVKAIEVKDFSARIWRGAELKEVQKEDAFLANAVMIFQDSLREHYDNIREKHKPDLLRSGNYKYYLSVYDVIPTEIAKMTFDIKITEDTFGYSSAQDVINCSSTSNLSETLKSYNASNWNYLFLINVLHEIKNNTGTKNDINDDLIYKVSDKILRQDAYKNKHMEIKLARDDIRAYFYELELFDYLKRIQNLRWLQGWKHENSPNSIYGALSRLDAIESMQTLFSSTQHEMRIKTEIPLINEHVQNRLYTITLTPTSANQQDREYMIYFMENEAKITPWVRGAAVTADLLEKCVKGENTTLITHYDTNFDSIDCAIMLPFIRKNIFDKVFDKSKILNLLKLAETTSLMPEEKRFLFSYELMLCANAMINPFREEQYISRMDTPYGMRQLKAKIQQIRHDVAPTHLKSPRELYDIVLERLEQGTATEDE